MAFELSLTDSPSQRRAKIVATLGPASNTEPVFRDLVRAGVDVVRLNFSHGTHEEKLELIQMIRKVSREERKPLCILADLQGPKIRTSKLKDHQSVLLKAGSTAHHHAAGCSGNGHAGGHHFQDTGGKCRAGLADSAFGRADRVAGSRCRWRRCCLRSHQRRDAWRKQGHQSSRHSGAGSFAHRQGHARTLNSR